MTRLVVDVDALEELLSRMAVFAARFEVVGDDVAVRSRRVRGVWTGAAALRQDEAHSRWVAGAGEMAEALAVLRSIAVTARGNYLSAVRANLAMWS